MKRLFIINIALILLLAPFTAAAKPPIQIGEQDVLVRVVVDAPRALVAIEEFGEVSQVVMESKSVFDTNADFGTEYTRDELARDSDFFGNREDRAHWNLSIAKKLPFGTETTLQWTNYRTQLFGVPTIGGQQIFPLGPDYESRVTLGVSQPMMKNFAGMNDRGTVDMAKKYLQSADLNTKYSIAVVARDSLVVYWQWVISFGYIESRAKAVRDAEEFLGITMERKRLGTVEITDVMAARANLLRRKSALLGARRLTLDLEKELKVILGISEDAFVRPKNKNPHYINSTMYSNIGVSISRALENRWDYQALKYEVERQNINLQIKNNQRWPELDLIGTMAVNGLDSGYGRALDDVNNPLWTVGMNVSFPLENRMARGRYRTAKHSKAKAVVNLKAKENDISNSVANFIKRFRLNEQIVATYTKTSEIQRDKLVREMSKYSIGRSSSEIIILYQDDVTNTELAELEAWADYFQTVMDLKLAENDIIELEF